MVIIISYSKCNFIKIHPGRKWQKFNNIQTTINLRDVFSMWHKLLNDPFNEDNFAVLVCVDANNAFFLSFNLLWVQEGGKWHKMKFTFLILLLLPRAPEWTLSRNKEWKREIQKNGNFPIIFISRLSSFVLARWFCISLFVNNEPILHTFCFPILFPSLLPPPNSNSLATGPFATWDNGEVSSEHWTWIYFPFSLPSPRVFIVQLPLFSWLYDFVRFSLSRWAFCVVRQTLSFVMLTSFPAAPSLSMQNERKWEKLNFLFRHN